ncbi:Sugar or nucleoside kinase, ribokinase family [Bryocella elongata]|uniref:Sugar or nucleoside kinase, ribokinase family n=1 Tax=Bryocella elongata TaxID=863522 RepID=A0A1H5UT59_9BACT|nr:PfkB family carbohydrate kinase [Bryocella elongata]SEF78196.1 Sugar or nucleoside kinase, ribokinase family [Bryocella elongata]
MSYDVTVIGEIYLDHVFSGFAGWPGPGEEIFTDKYQWELGGGAVNTACALARLGRSVQLIGVVGRGEFPAIEQRLAHFGVSAGNLVLSDTRTGVTVSVSVAEERTLFSYRGANEHLLALLESTPSLLRSAAESRHVHLALPLPAGSIATVVRVLASDVATTSLDVGHDVAWLQSDSSAQVMQAVDYLLPNAKEAQVMSGSVSGYLDRCRALGCSAVVKLGAAGAVMVAEGREVRVAPPSVQVLDTTGAGDAFDAGFIDGLLAGLDPRGCLELGCICGSLSTRAAGSLEALPSREEIAIVKETHVA